jgi:uncharacterized protein YjbI with pentapeptide repeats
LNSRAFSSALRIAREQNDRTLQPKEVCGADLRNANLTEVNLGGANLSGANLTAAKLGVADLRNAHLSEANLGGADLITANLGGADLTGAHLYGSEGLQQQLRTACGDATTILPPGIKPLRICGPPQPRATAP